MRHATLFAGSCLLALATVVSAGSSAKAQDIWSMNANFDRQFNNQLAAMQQQNANQMEQLWQHHLRVNGPRMQRQYRAFVAAGNRGISYEQFAYYDLMTAAGTNVAGGLAAQQAQAEGYRTANATVQSGYASYNAGMADNSRRTSAALANYSNQAIRGYSPYNDGGTTRMLPYYLADGQTYSYGGNTYAQDRAGTYYRQNGNYWQPLQAGR